MKTKETPTTTAKKYITRNGRLEITARPWNPKDNLVTNLPPRDGDMLILDSQGRWDRCLPDIFSKTYIELGTPEADAAIKARQESDDAERKPVDKKQGK